MAHVLCSHWPPVAAPPKGFQVAERCRVTHGPSPGGVRPHPAVGRRHLHRQLRAQRGAEEDEDRPHEHVRRADHAVLPEQRSAPRPRAAWESKRRVIPQPTLHSFRGEPVCRRNECIQHTAVGGSLPRPPSRGPPFSSWWSVWRSDPPPRVLRSATCCVGRNLCWFNGACPVRPPIRFSILAPKVFPSGCPNPSVLGMEGKEGAN